MAGRRIMCGMAGAGMLAAAAACVGPVRDGGAATGAVGAARLSIPIPHATPWTATTTGGPSAALLALAPAAAAGDTSGITPANPFVEQAAVADSQRALDCLTQAVYYEARSEPLEGQQAVAQVVLNRTRNPAYPNSVCGTVYEGSTRSTGCQFSFTCDGSLARRREPTAWARAAAVAAAALGGFVYAPVGTATYYHTTAIHPWWADKVTTVATIGAHIFYRLPGSWGGIGAFSQAYAGAEPVLAAGRHVAPKAVEDIVERIEAGVTVHRGSGFTDVAATTGTDAATPPTAAPAPAVVAGVRIHRGAVVDTAATGVTVHRGLPGSIDTL